MNHYGIIFLKMFVHAKLRPRAAEPEPRGAAKLALATELESSASSLCDVVRAV